MNILLIGECFSPNLGDAVICQTVSKLIKSKYPDACITYFDMFGRINYNELHNDFCYSNADKCFFKVVEKFPRISSKNRFVRMYNEDNVRHIRAAMLLRKCLENMTYDVAIFAGGAMFMDCFSWLIYYIVKVLSKQRIPVVFHACGMGKLSADSIELLRKTFARKNCKSVSLRDSIEKFDELFGDVISTKETYDTALCTNMFYDKSDTIVAEYGVGVICIPEYIPFQIAFVKELVKRGIDFKLFINGSPEDLNVANVIIEESGTNYKDIIVKKPNTPDELVKTITSFKRIVSFRLHSLIIATSYGVEHYGFVWDNKVIDFYNKLEIVNYCNPLNMDFCIEDILYKETFSEKNKKIIENAQKTVIDDLYSTISNCFK